LKNKMMERYSRQILLSEIGSEGQKQLHASKVVVVGVGALGTVATELLVRAGVENLTLIDRDVVEESNLQRQMLFTEKDIGRSKAIVAQEKLQLINSRTDIIAQPVSLHSGNIALLQSAEVVLDCTDNIQTRLLINDFCKKEKIVWIYAAAIRTAGYVMPIVPEGPCLRCFLQETGAETCDTVGVLNTITTAIASMQVTLALQFLLGQTIEPNLIYYDIWKQHYKNIVVKKNKNCPACQGKYEFLGKKEPIRMVKFCSLGRYQVTGKKVDLKILKQRWEKIDTVIDDGKTLQFKDLFLFEDGRALIKAKSEAEAMSLYAKWVEN